MSFTNGQRVEVVQIEEGLEGAWFAAKILPFPKNLPKKRKRVKKNFYVEYENLFKDEGTKQLREYIDFTRLRPIPPEDLDSTRAFQVNEEVDAFWCDAWWKGVITKAHSGGLRYSIFFETTLEELEYDRADLRTHHDWVDGNWIRSQIQITSLDCLGTVLSKEKEETRESPNQTGESAFASDMGTPQSSSGPINIVVENVMPSSGNVCEITDDSVVENVMPSSGNVCAITDDSSNAKHTHSSYDSRVSKKENIFTQVRDRLTKKLPLAVKASGSRTSSSKALDVFAYLNKECQRNFTEIEHDTRLHGPSHEDQRTVLPMGQTKRDICSSQGIKLMGVGGIESQPEVLEREHLKELDEKTKRRKEEARTVCRSQGDENECTANDIQDSQRECTPLPIQFVEENHLILQPILIPGHDPKSASKENEVVDSVCEDHQLPPLSVCPILPETGDTSLDSEPVSAGRDGSTERFVLSETSTSVGPIFIKKVWEIIKSIEVFKSIPQEPNFGPLEQKDGFHREGCIIGHMLNFASLAEKLKHAKLENPRSMYEDMSKAFCDFKELGFFVDPFISHLEELLELKNSYNEIEESSKSAKNEFIAAKSDSDQLQESNNGAKMKLKREMTEMEMRASKLAETERALHEIKGQLEIAQLDFKTAVQAPF